MKRCGLLLGLLLTGCYGNEASVWRPRDGARKCPFGTAPTVKQDESWDNAVLIVCLPTLEVCRALASAPSAPATAAIQDHAL